MTLFLHFMLSRMVAYLVRLIHLSRGQGITIIVVSEHHQAQQRDKYKRNRSREHRHIDSPVRENIFYFGKKFQQKRIEIVEILQYFFCFKNGNNITDIILIYISLSFTRGMFVLTGYCNTGQ